MMVARLTGQHCIHFAESFQVLQVKKVKYWQFPMIQLSVFSFCFLTYNGGLESELLRSLTGYVQGEGSPRSKH